MENAEADVPDQLGGLVMTPVFTAVTRFAPTGAQNEPR